MGRFVSLGSASDEEVADLVERHIPLFVSVIRRLGVAAQDRDDALQGAREGFLEALQRFDPNRGVTIGSYARGDVIKGVLRAIGRDHRTTRKIVLVGLEDGRLDGRYDDAGFDEVETLLDSSHVRSFLQRLPKVQMHVARRMGMDGVSASTVARERGTSVAAVSKTWKKIKAVGTVQLAHLIEVA